MYTFSRSGTDAYSFSFTVPAIFTADTADLQVTPISAGPFTFNDSALSTDGTDFCFAFGDGSTDALSDGGGVCGLASQSGISGVLARFSGADVVGTFPAESSFSIPVGLELTQLTISSNAAPEPATLAVLALALAGIGLAGRHRLNG